MPSPGERAKICLVWIMVPVSITLNFVASIALVNIDHKSIFCRGIIEAPIRYPRLKMSRRIHRQIKGDLATIQYLHEIPIDWFYGLVNTYWSVASRLRVAVTFLLGLITLVLVFNRHITFPLLPAAFSVFVGVLIGSCVTLKRILGYLLNYEDSVKTLESNLLDAKQHEIVGVVEDGKYESLTEDPEPTAFLPMPQYEQSSATLVVRSHPSSADNAFSLQNTVSGIVPDVPYTLRSWSDALGPVLFPARAATMSLGVMGLLAAMLAVTGIFGMAAYAVSKRMKELAIRVDLGAQPLQLMWSAVSRPLILLLSDSAIGLLIGLLASRLLAKIVYSATPDDPLVLTGVITAMTLLGLRPPGFQLGEH
jgi:hypothetical protein